MVFVRDYPNIRTIELPLGWIDSGVNDFFKCLFPYPPDYLTGAMCAWDKEGIPGPNSTIKTFATVQDVEDANYEIIHCGACGDCSNWNDIQLQYTSSKYLAGIATVWCAQYLSLFCFQSPSRWCMS